MNSGHFHMKKLAWIPFFGLLTLCGCVHHYIITLNNGMQLDTHSKPKLENGAYYFKDARGDEQHVPAGSVHEISPASLTHPSQAPNTPGSGS